jgi:hypothetical protein
MGLTGTRERPKFGTKLTESGRGCVTPTRKTPSFLSTPEICSSFAFLFSKRAPQWGALFLLGRTHSGLSRLNRPTQSARALMGRSLVVPSNSP